MKKKKIIVIVSIAAFFLLAWSPWITTEYAREKIMSRQDFFEVHGKDNAFATMQIHILEEEKFRLEHVLSKEATDGIVSGAKIFSFSEIPKVTKNIGVEIGLIDVKILESENS